jgi:hypothetical protein
VESAGHGEMFDEADPQTIIRVSRECYARPRIEDGKKILANRYLQHLVTYNSRIKPAWIVGTNSPLLLGSRNSSHPGVTPTSRGGVLNAAVLGRANSEVPETPTDQPERCIRRFVLSVARTL